MVGASSTALGKKEDMVIAYHRDDYDEGEEGATKDNMDPSVLIWFSKKWISIRSMRCGNC